MALPDTISGSFAPKYHVGGPFESGGNYYFVGRESTTPHRIMVFKSTNPGTDAWNGATSHVNPAAEAFTSIFAVQDGTNIHIAMAHGTDGTVDYKYYRYSISFNTFITLNESIIQVQPNLDASGTGGISLAVRSDGEVVALIEDEHDAWHGGDYNRISYLNRTSGTWDASTTAVDAGTGGVSYTLPRSVLGASNKVHFTYYDGSNIQHKSLSSGDSLSSAEAVNDTTPTDGNSRLAYLNDGSNDLVMTAWIKDSDDKVYTSLITDDGTPAAEGATSDAVIWVVSNTFSLTADDTNDKFYAAWSGTANDLFHDEYDAGWGTDVETWDAVTISAIGGANVYQNDAGDTVLAYVVDNGGTIQYNEYTLVAGAAGSFPPRLRPLRMLRR